MSRETPNTTTSPARRRSGAPPAFPAPAGGLRAAPRSSPVTYGPEDFPGCEPFRRSAAEVDEYEGRLEFWESRTETAWRVSEPTTIYHERPARRLSRLVERIESLRGSRIESFGSADLARFDAAGRKALLVQADEVLYVYPRRSRVSGPSIDVDRDPLPDVVLEVDHTTDASSMLTC